MKPNEVKTALFDSIQALTDYKWLFSSRPGKDNTRNRKFPFQKMIASTLAFKGGTLNHEIMDFYGLDPSIGTASAFIQQRAKILPEAFETLFQHFTQTKKLVGALAPIPKNIALRSMAAHSFRMLYRTLGGFCTA